MRRSGTLHYPFSIIHFPLSIAQGRFYVNKFKIFIYIEQYKEKVCNFAVGNFIKFLLT